ncbi:ImmA/IrrE family metallo-endopeptidase [Pimelobacter simplex]|uniref:ImmA/IrrE family metallo-endopeptidase n=1 Tax=Nocardioides simplex TaxID=2045 RepID=A0A7J5DV76_NOCSI|nr:ImmA/IrrE family metallo-endopeptidase [Pimelobacter simplex]KAB2809223.1 ImmA/IrrE family metallo-endopeptidase [Pimelobacter simplex]
MTRDRLMEVFNHCADLGIEVEWAHLGEYVRGGYEWRSGRIYLSLLLTAAQAVSTLVHELGHHKFGDRCTDPIAERRAWEYGAAFLINPEEYREAERLVGHHASALAIELGVTPKLIEAWRRWWQTRGHLLTDLQLGAGEGQ